jgi:hypothetical protein
LARAQNSWRLQKKPLQQSMQAVPLATQPNATNTPRQQG